MDAASQRASEQAHLIQPSGEEEKREEDKLVNENKTSQMRL